jgi:D-alanyl-D-alanine carboxypeptidase
MRRAALGATVLATLLATGCGSDDPPPSAGEVEAALEDAVAAGAPGVALQIDGPEGEEFLGAGEADLDPSRPIDRDDTYRIASVTKSFTAAIVMQLVAEGELSLEDTVAEVDPKLLPEAGDVTISQLLGHTSGLSDYVEDEAFAEVVSQGEELTPEQVLGFVANEPPEFEPGSEYDYSDTDNLVLGFLIEEVTGNTYEQELESRIIEPLGLTETRLATDFEFPEPHAQGHQFDPDAEPGSEPEDITDVPIDPNGAWASGALISTPADMATFFAALLGDELVPSAQLEAMMETRPGAGSPAGPGTNNAGLGIFRWDVACGEIWGHTGAFPGFRAIGAAAEDGSGSFGMVVNATELPQEAEDAVLRAQELAACRALGEPAE